MSNEDLLHRITARPDVFGGKPIIRDMRGSVDLILSLLSQGVTAEDILDDYPDLEPEDIHSCIAYARAAIFANMVDDPTDCADEFPGKESRRTSATECGRHWMRSMLSSLRISTRH